MRENPNDPEVLTVVSKVKVIHSDGHISFLEPYPESKLKEIVAKGDAKLAKKKADESSN